MHKSDELLNIGDLVALKHWNTEHDQPYGVVIGHIYPYYNDIKWVIGGGDRQQDGGYATVSLILVNSVGKDNQDGS